ncbi:hypothetical protein SCH01S_01_01300 [Sphingomonas changbaiensis NBRC 104936]|uniref:Putative Flp pilus-assembly TadG-like N-terminal domain-containing protein n=1 Tax=Sphingomonas changbaiensis NBRC 104936 TaxID=1219043 RepID=A0A0E9MJJ7_9SPHN|nr:pilus assembly protein TadG-related protein [Sphingomonas changbaiensis]GAO37967.1 hypothetical protein SCH01S_01_01300 [Sphingomonas changbaiensis NBRC 104936]
MRAFVKLLELARASRGNVIVAAAASLPVVIGSAGLATDTLQWVLWKRQLQRQADSAALSGAFALAQGKSASTSATADIARTAEVALTAAPLIETPPSTGAGAGNTNAVRVAVQTSHSLAFSSLFLVTPPTIKAESTAAVVQDGHYCVIALEPTTMAGITMTGSSTVNMGCGMATNSRSSNAVSAGGNSSITATPIAAVGTVVPSGNYNGDTVFKSHQIPQADPFASVPDPDISTRTDCVSSYSIGPHGNGSLTSSFNPATATCLTGGVDIKGTLTLGAGIYYVDGSTFSVGSQGKIVGQNVTIILTSKDAATKPATIATVTMNGGAEINLSAPSDGTYQGLIFYQDRRAADGSANKVNGNTNSFYQGALYFPKQQVTFNGTAGMSTDCMQIVGRRVEFLGNSSIQNVCPAASGAHSFTGTAVRLIG